MYLTVYIIFYIFLIPDGFPSYLTLPSFATPLLDLFYFCDENKWIKWKKQVTDMFDSCFTADVLLSVF